MGVGEYAVVAGFIVGVELAILGLAAVVEPWLLILLFVLPVLLALWGTRMESRLAQAKASAEEAEGRHERALQDEQERARRRIEDAEEAAARQVREAHALAAQVDAEARRVAQESAYVAEWRPKVEAFRNWEALPAREKAVADSEAALRGREELLRKREGELEKRMRTLVAKEGDVRSRERRLEAELDGLQQDVFAARKLVKRARALLESIERSGPTDESWRDLGSLEERLRREHGMSYGRRD